MGEVGLGKPGSNANPNGAPKARNNMILISRECHGQKGILGSEGTDRELFARNRAFIDAVVAFARGGILDTLLG